MLGNANISLPGQGPSSTPEGDDLHADPLHLIRRGLRAVIVEHRLPWRVRRAGIRMMKRLNTAVAAPIRRRYLPWLLHRRQYEGC